MRLAPDSQFQFASLYRVSDFSRNGHGLGILLDGGLDDVGGRPIMTEMDHLGPGRLQDRSAA